MKNSEVLLVCKSTLGFLAVDKISYIIVIAKRTVRKE